MQNDVSLQDQKYQLGAQVAGIGLGVVDYIADTIVLDERAAALFDLDADVAVPRDALHDRIHPADRPGIDYKVENLLNPDYADVIEVEHRVCHSDGTIVWVNARKKASFAEVDGVQRPQTGLVALIDVTSRHTDQDRIQFLLDELNHRSKNLLTVVQGIARRTMASGSPEDFNERFSNRLAGLIHNHDAMVRGSWTHANLGELVSAHLAAFGGVTGKRITASGPETRLSNSQSQAIGMALHELATNATKYGALSGAQGRVQIEWTLNGGDFQIVWKEHGGPPVSPPSRKGFGQRVIDEIAAASVNGAVDLDYAPDGLRWQLTFPAAELL